MEYSYIISEHNHELPEALDMRKDPTVSDNSYIAMRGVIRITVDVDNYTFVS